MRRASLSIVAPSRVRVAGQVATAALLVAICLQVLLALGIVPISMAWGGTEPVLTPPLRMASLAAAVILSGFTYVIRWRAGLTARARSSRLIKLLAWGVTLYLILNTLGNFASATTMERLLFGPLSLVAALACLLVSATGTDE